MSASAPVNKDHPLMKAWEAYKATPEYENTKKWALSPRDTDGSLWASFLQGWEAAGGQRDYQGRDESKSGTNDGAEDAARYRKLKSILAAADFGYWPGEPGIALIFRLPSGSVVSGNLDRTVDALATEPHKPGGENG